MDIFGAILGFAGYVSIRHVLVLNLLGWTIKCLLRHRGWDNWTDVIPVILGISGIAIAAFDDGTYQGNFIVYGLANAGLAWMLHRMVKPLPQVVKRVTNRNGQNASGDQ